MTAPSTNAGPPPAYDVVLPALPATAFLVLDHAAYAVAAGPCLTRAEVRAELGRLLGRPGFEHLSVVAIPWHHYLALFADLMSAKAGARRGRSDPEHQGADDAHSAAGAAAAALWRAEVVAVAAALDVADSYHPDAHPRRRFPRPLHPPTPAHSEPGQGCRVVPSVVLHEVHEVRELHGEAS